MADISVPSNATLDRLNEIIVGWYRAKAHDAPAQITEVEKRTGIPYSTISRQNAFLQEAGFLQKDASGFRLTLLGTEYAKFLDFGQLEEAKRVLRKVFRKWETFQPLFDYLDLQGPLSSDDLIGRIGLAAEKKASGGTRTGIIALIDLLKFGDLVKEKDGGLDLNRELFQEERERGPVKPAERETRTSITPPSPMPDVNVRINLSLNLDHDADPKKLRALLEVVRKALYEEAD